MEKKLSYFLTACAAAILVAGGCVSDPGSSGAAPAEPEEATTTAAMTVEESGSGKIRAVVLADTSRPSMSAVFSGTLALDDHQCVVLEGTEGMTTIAFTDLERLGSDGEDAVTLGSGTYTIGDEVTIVGGVAPSDGQPLEACGNPTEVIIASSVG